MWSAMWRLCAVPALLFGSTAVVYGHGAIQDPPARNWFCGAITKPDHVLNGVAQYPVCGQAFANDFTGGYNFMGVLTHAQGRSVVSPLPQNVCGFNSETWHGGITPWDQPIDWPTTPVTAGPRTFTWNIAWGPHYSDTKEFKYWITKPGFQFQIGRPLTWDDFEPEPFCALGYDDAQPNANPDVIPDKAATLFRTRCNVPERAGRHVIYGEWGRNQWTYERFHSCMDVTFNGGAPAPSFTLAGPAAPATLTRGASTIVTINVARTNGFADPVDLSVSGLPAGVTAVFNPSSTSGASAHLTLAASLTAATGSATLTVTGASGALARTVAVPIQIAAEPGYTLSLAPTSLTVAPGATGAATITIARTGGFSGGVQFTATGLPAGLSATVDPALATGSTATVTVTASAGATPGTYSAILTGTSGSLSRTLTLPITVPAPGPSTFTLSANPGNLTLPAAGAANTTVSIAREGGFSAPVTLTATELPSGISAVFNPATTTGSSANLTLSANSSAVSGSATALLTATGGGVTRTLALPFTVQPPANPGAVSVATAVNINHGWYTEIAVRVTNAQPITGLIVTVNLRKTPGVTRAGQYNTVGDRIQHSTGETAEALVYTYTLTPGQGLWAGSWLFAAQAGGNGTVHPTAGDTYTVTYTLNGETVTSSGTF